MPPAVADGIETPIPCAPMIRLTPQDVAEFRSLYRRETGRDISDDQAREYAERLIRLVAFAAGQQLPPPRG